MKTKKQAAIGFIFITMLIDVIGIGIIIPVIPSLLGELNHSNISDAAQLGGWLAFAYSFTQFLFAPIMGSLSDKYGRRPMILLSLLAFSIDYLILGIAPSVGWLFVARIVAGITGASISTAMAYIADVSTPENKAKNFGLVGTAFGVGFIIGPVLGGLLGQFGARVPFFAAAFLCFINFIYGYFILPESLPQHQRRNFQWKSANPVGALFRLKRYPKISWLIVALFFMYFASHSVNGNWSYYTIYKFGWDDKMVGISLGVVGLLMALVQGVLVRFLNPKIGNSKSILIGYALNAIGLVLFGIASNEFLIFIFLIPYCLGGIAGPAIQSEITNHVPRDEQGQIQGTLASISSATATFGTLVMTSIFYFFTHENAPFQFAGAPFIFGAFLVFLAWISAWKGLQIIKRTHE